MIGVRITDDFLDMDKDTRVSLTLVSPLFNEDTLSPGSVSMPFDVASGESSPKNAVLLGNPDVLENTEGFRKVDAQLYFDRLPLKKGKLVVRSHSGNKTSTNFNFGLGTISDEIKTKKIADIIAELITIWEPDTIKKLYVKPKGSYSTYSLNVNGKIFSGANITDLASAINADTEIGATATVEGSTTSPMGMTAAYIILQPDEDEYNPLTPLSVDNTDDCKYDVHTHDFTSYDAAFTSIFSDGLTDERFGFPFHINFNLYGEAGGNETNVGYVNNSSSFLIVNDANYGFDNNLGMVSKNNNSLQPFLKMRYMLDKIAEYFGFEYEGDFFSKSEIDDMFIWNTASLDVPLAFIGTKKFVFWRSSFNLSELVPDITVRDFFMLLQGRYNLSFGLTEDTLKLRVVMREAAAKSYATEDITTKAGQDIQIEDLRYNGYRMEVPKEDTDYLLTHDDYSSGGEDEKVITIQCRSFNAAGLVYASQKNGSKFGLKIFYRHSGNQAWGEPPSGEWKETLSGTDGLHDYFWKYWLYYDTRRRLVKLPMDLSFADLYAFDWEQKHRLNFNDYLVKKIEVELSNKGISVSSVEMMTMF